MKKERGEMREEQRHIRRTSHQKNPSALLGHTHLCLLLLLLLPHPNDISMPRGGGWNGPTDAAIIIFLFEIPECEFPHLFLSKKKGEGGCAAAPKLPFCAEKWVLFSSQRRLYPNHFSRRPNEQDKHKSRQTVKNGDFKDHR